MTHVLIVDDEPEYLDELTEALAFRGLSTRSVGRGPEAIDGLRRASNIRIVPTHMREPAMDGVPSGGEGVGGGLGGGGGGGGGGPGRRWCGHLVEVQRGSLVGGGAWLG